jgi:hypothetical protein
MNANAARNARHVIATRFARKRRQASDHGLRLDFVSAASSRTSVASFASSVASLRTRSAFLFGGAVLDEAEPLDRIVLAFDSVARIAQLSAIRMRGSISV